tara:strand:- start:135 stop:359 length:225 start_codon:yes stop_codon:yes gene_type:complete
MSEEEKNSHDINIEDIKVVSSKEKMLDYICGETKIDLANPYDGLLWDIYTLRAEIDERISKIEKTIWILRSKNE